ncbi:MAG: serine--tRNA ligase, partial [Armatimonadetes bacterium]|nr:serine--tRNA ligase [Akkermansiaceae bacterium]
MLDIRVIREKSEEVRERLKARGDGHWKLIDEVLACDESRRSAETTKQELQNQRKTISKQIGMMKSNGEDSSSVESEVRAINEAISKADLAAEAAGNRQNELLLNIPNLPHPACPVGDNEEANPVLRVWGEKPLIAEPLDHVELALKHGLVSWEDAIRISGSGFAVYRGKGARLERALINFLLDTQSENGYEEV